MFSKFHKNQKGFTLIELMIVVVIIGILAALAIPRFMQSTAKGKQSSASYILTQIANAEREHHKEHGIYLDVGNTAKPGEQFGLLGVKIPADCPYTFTIDETPTGGLLFTAEGNIDNDAVVDIWTKDLTNNNPVNTQNDVTLR